MLTFFRCKGYCHEGFAQEPARLSRMGEQGLVREAATTRSRPERVRAAHGNSADQSLLRGRKDFFGPSHRSGARFSLRQYRGNAAAG
ncbi:hypothetical protein D3C72_1785320 [compost metagenome]